MGSVRRPLLDTWSTSCLLEPILIEARDGVVATYGKCPSFLIDCLLVVNKEKCLHHRKRYYTDKGEKCGDCPEYYREKVEVGWISPYLLSCGCEVVSYSQGTERTYCEDCAEELRRLMR